MLIRVIGRGWRVAGFSLIEALVSIAILGIIASVTIPYTKVQYVRNQEIKLKQNLRTIRTAIDRFHADCVSGKIAQTSEGVSQDCFPETLEYLVEGVQSGDAGGAFKYYLRRIPKDPFSDDDHAFEHWEIRGYRDSPDGAWSGDDVFDVRVKTDKMSLNGSNYVDW